MDSLYVYNRVLLKLSGESLKGDSESGYDAETVNDLVNRIGEVCNKGIEMGIVIGGGNIWRGVKGVNSGMDRVTADYMGMLATVMNAICLRDAFNSAGFIAEVQTSIPMMPIASPFDREKAVKSLGEGRIVIFAGGTGGGFEIDGIAEDCGQHQTSNLGGNSHAIQIVHNFKNGTGAANRLIEEINRLIGGDITDFVVINDSDNIVGGEIIRGLRQIAVIYQCNFFASGVGHDLRGGKAKTLEHGLGLRIQFSLHNRDVIFPFGFHQFSKSNCCGYRIGIRTFVTKNIN